MEFSNIPLLRRERWGPCVIDRCARCRVAFSYILSSFALVFAVSSVVALPSFGLCVSALPCAASRPQGRYLGRHLFVSFGYIAVTKWVLVPFLVRLLQSGLTLRSTRRATAGFASLRAQVNSNVRPHDLRTAWVRAASCWCSSDASFWPCHSLPDAGHCVMAFRSGAGLCLRFAKLRVLHFREAQLAPQC